MIASQPAHAREFAAIDLIEQVDLFRLDANRQLDSRRRVELGQFMTPAPIARLMAAMLVVRYCIRYTAGIWTFQAWSDCGRVSARVRGRCGIARRL